MNTFYSEGEWSICDWTDPKTKITYLAVRNEERIICLISPQDSVIGDDTENAKLIATAPFMRKQLEHLGECLKAYPALEYERSVIQDLLERTGYPNLLPEDSDELPTYNL
jgi:hypothetical protein